MEDVNAGIENALSGYASLTTQLHNNKAGSAEALVELEPAFRSYRGGILEFLQEGPNLGINFAPISTPMKDEARILANWSAAKISAASHRLFIQDSQKIQRICKAEASYPSVSHATSTTPTSTTTSTTIQPKATAPPIDDIGQPPGDGGPWEQAPQALVLAINQLQTSSSNVGSFTNPNVSYWISEDPNTPQWYFVAVDQAFTSPNLPGQLDGIEELTNGTWNLVSYVGEQAPGCYGPGHIQPNGPFAVPANILSDFGQTC